MLEEQGGLEKDGEVMVQSDVSRYALMPCQKRMMFIKFLH